MPQSLPRRLPSARAPRGINLLDGGIYETYHLAPARQLTGQVEADEAYQSAGSKGLVRQVAPSGRTPRPRGIKLRGRAPAAHGRAPLFGLVQRRDQKARKSPPAPVFLEVPADVRPATIKPLVLVRVKASAEFFTDEYNIYHFAAEAGYTHRTVNHGAGEYARYAPDGVCVHCNTMEGIWASLRNFLARFKDISQRFLPLRVGRFEFLHNHGHLSWQHIFETAGHAIFSTTGRYLRRMVHQHRRIPLTACYR